MSVRMLSTVTVDAIPLDAQAVAGYVGDWCTTYWKLVARCPKAMHLAIAVSAEEDAECLDVETGDATPAEVPAWVRRQLDRGVRRPVIYASVSTMATILALLEEAGIASSEIRLWTAHYTQVAHLCGPESCGYGLPVSADATEWTDRALDSNLSESMCADAFFGPPPPPPDPNHYAWYPVGPFPFRDAAGELVRLNERAIVETYDHLRLHAQLNSERLNELRVLLTFLRKRVWYVSHYEPSTGRKRPSVDWDSFYRGWRWQRLLARSRGESVAK
jgi:hypothetical protein